MPVVCRQKLERTGSLYIYDSPKFDTVGSGRRDDPTNQRNIHLTMIDVGFKGVSARAPPLKVAKNQEIVLWIRTVCANIRDREPVVSEKPPKAHHRLRECWESEPVCTVLGSLKEVVEPVLKTC